MTAEYADYTAGRQTSDSDGVQSRTIYRDETPIALLRMVASIPFDAELAQDICAALWAHEQRLRGAP